MTDVAKKIVELIANNFPNGIRDDFIDTNKLLRIFSANHADEDISREFIAEVIRSGMQDGGRFYFISDDDARNILQLVEKILRSSSIAYYCRLHEKHADFFARRKIFSPDVLKKFLREVDAEHFYFDEFCAANRATRPIYEVAKIFMAAGKSLSLDDLQERLPYVPPEKISELLAGSKRFLPTAAGKFIAVSAIQFDTDEIAAAKQQISAAIDAKGFAAPDDYDFTSNFALNPEVSEKLLRGLIYEKFFAADFGKQGRRFVNRNTTTKARDSIGPMNRLRKFISEQDELSLKELLAAAENVSLMPSVAVHAAHEQMIRVEKNLFIRDTLITFDVAGVDEALTPFVQGKIIPLRAVTSFTGFPAVEGYSWNLFMLESFLRKYSRKYTFDVAAANSASVGAIYPKSMTFANYLDVQAAAVVQEHVPLESSAVAEFLVEQGYRANRIAKITDRIIARAQEILRH